MDKSLNFITRTSIDTENHKACVCVVCDCFIIGTESICWLSTEQLKGKECVLSTNFLEASSTKKLPQNLRNEYKIDGNDELSNLLLSPRAHVTNGKYMSCESCYRNIAYSDEDKPPKFAISNGWCIGQLPETLIKEDIDNILESLVARYRTFATVYSYNAGAHKAIKGHHCFFSK